MLRRYGTRPPSNPLVFVASANCLTIPVLLDQMRKKRGKRHRKLNHRWETISEHLSNFWRRIPAKRQATDRGDRRPADVLSVALYPHSVV